MESHAPTLSQVTSTLLRPSKWVSSYEDMVTKNANTVGQIESALRSLIYIIPGELYFILFLVARWSKLMAVGRFRESELPSECGKKRFEP